MRVLTFSLYKSAYDTKSQPITQPWEEWVEIFSEHDIRPSDGNNIKALEATKDGPCFVLGEIPAGESHKNEAVVAAHALGLDIEHQTEDEILAALEKVANYEYIAYSTHKHKSPATGEEPRIRVIFPLKEPVGPEAFPAVWRGLDRLTGGINDKQTKNISRLFYAPTSWSADVVEFHRNASDTWISAADLEARGAAPSEAAPGSSDYDLKRLTWAVRNMRKDNPLKNAAKLMAEGEPYAAHGYRHETGLKLTLWIASTFVKNPLGEAAIEEAFSNSIDKMQALDSDAPGMDDLLASYRGALSKAEASHNEHIYRKQLKGLEPYSGEELQEIADAQGCTLDELENRWIIQKGKSFYLLDGNSNYRLVEHAEARPAAAAILRRAPVPLFEPTRTGYRRKNIEELSEDHGTVAEKAIGDLTIQKSRYDPETLEMHEAVKPIRTDLEPIFHQKIDDYFKIMAGESYDKFCDWLACFPDLDKLLCAVYIVGPRDVFKTGLATGLAKIWQGQGTPTPLKTLLREFNENLVLMSPLVVADESIPREWKGQSITAELREMISITSRPLNRKYLSSSLLVGSIRLMLCANNEFLLQTDKVPTPEDLEATAERFLYIRVPDAAHTWKEKHISSTEAKFWCEGGGFAQHCLWLYKNREVIPASRFWVEGDIGEMHSLLLSGSEFNSMINYWLTQYLNNPQPVDNLVQQSGLVRVRDGELLVNDQALIDYWEIYHKKTRVEPKPGKVATALRSISEKGWTQLRFNKKQIRYRKINVYNLYSWAKDHGYGDRFTMNETLCRDEAPGAEEYQDKVRPMPTGDERKKILAARVGVARVQKEE